MEGSSRRAKNLETRQVNATFQLSLGSQPLINEHVGDAVFQPLA